MKRFCVLLALMLAATNVCAHSASNGFVTLTVSDASVDGSLELAIRDGELAVGLDADTDGRVTWGELRAQQRAIENYVRDRLIIGAGHAPCHLSFAPLQVNERVDGSYLWLPLTAACSATPRQLNIDYRLLDDVDPSHRGLLVLTAVGATQTAVLGGAAGTQSFSFIRPDPWRTLRQFLRTGVWHIWSGIDHLLFLFSLLLPAVLLRREGRWEAVPLARPALLNVVKVVTAFTLAHSITLTLAALDVVRLPSRLTESVIAASIIVAALNNVFPRITDRWRIAFAFGLLHGFGFASVLAEMGLPPGARSVALVAFNLGVEFGQLAVVVAIMPLAFAVRRTTFYCRGVMPWGSTLIACLALVWLFQRALG